LRCDIKNPEKAHQNNKETNKQQKNNKKINKKEEIQSSSGKTQ
jgi:hypothetical protein